MDTVIYQQTFTIKGNEKSSDITLIPCTISSAYKSGINNYQPTPATGEKRDRIIKKMNGYLEELGDLIVSYK